MKMNEDMLDRYFDCVYDTYTKLLDANGFDCVNHFNIDYKKKGALLTNDVLVGGKRKRFQTFLPYETLTLMIKEHELKSAIALGMKLFDAYVEKIEEKEMFDTV